MKLEKKTNFKKLEVMAMNNEIEYGRITGTVTGTVVAMVVNLGGEDVIRTIVTAGIGAVVSFVVSMGLKGLIDWWRGR